MSEIVILKDVKERVDLLPDIARLQKASENFKEKLRKKILFKNAQELLFLSAAEKTKKEAYDLLERYQVCELKKNYVGKKVTADDVNNNPDNIKTYEEGSQEFTNKFIYYNNKINSIPSYESEEKFYNRNKFIQYNENESTYLADGFDLRKYLIERGPVVVAQEFFGAGVTCLVTCDVPDPKTGKIPITQPEYDVYDDRITKIYYDSVKSKIIIQEFYRANVDLSIRKKLAVIDGGKPTHAGAFDFIVGKFGAIGDEISLRLFHYENYNKYPQIPASLTKVMNCYKNNSFDFTNYYALTQTFGEFVKTKNVNEGDKKCILVHRGPYKGNGSEGCLTIAGCTNLSDEWDDQNQGDYAIFKKDFELYKLGMLFLFRDELITN